MYIKKLTIFSNAMHSEQILTGIRILERNKVITIGEVSFDNSLLVGSKSFYGQPFVIIEFLDYKLLFDTSDTFELPSMDWLFSLNISHYFKRSFKIEGYTKLPFKIFPLGFNYLTFTNQSYRVLFAQLRASLFQKNLIHFLITRNELLSKLFQVNNSITNCNIFSTHDFYDNKKKDLIFYSTRLWNPNSAKNDEERRKRFILNEKRIQFVIELKKYFKERFVGGIFNDEFSRKLVSNEFLINRYFRKDYVSILRSAKVGISVNGVHSAGWAIGEYCAFGLGIVCDPLSIKLPGLFELDNNYLQASSTDELITSCELLLSNKDNILQNQITNNYSYYYNYLSPDKLVLNSILSVFSDI